MLITAFLYLTCFIVLKKNAFEKNLDKNHLFWKKPVFIGFFQKRGFFANPVDSSINWYWFLYQVMVLCLFRSGSCCPRNCSGAGACSISGSCDCDDGFLGEACRVPICPNGKPMETRPIAISRVLREQRRTDGPTDRPTEWLIESRARD